MTPMRDWKNVRLSKLIEMYLKFMDDKDCSPHTLRHYKTTLYDFNAYMENTQHETPKLKNISIEHLEAYLSDRKKRGNCGKTRENVIITLRSFWNYLCKRGYANTNVARLLHRFSACLDTPT